MNKNKYPLFLPFVSLLLGILVASQINFVKFETQELSILGFFVLSFLILGLRQKYPNFLPYLLLIVLGAFSYFLNNQLYSDHHFSKTPNASRLVIKVSEITQSTKSQKLIADVLTTESKVQKTKVKGKIMIYLPLFCHIQKGALYSIPANFKAIEEFRNPGVFNYARFLQRQNIFHSTYLKSEDFILLKAPASIHRILHQCQNSLSNLFYENLENKENAAILNSILLGQRKDLSKETRQKFNDNGLAHLLAVSGMHVGIVLLIIQFMVRLWSNQILKTFMIITGVWIYILLTGNQIPAIRAGFMLTIHALAFLFQRNPRPINSIFFAAMVLLSHDPNLIFQLSFQLSFTAMMSIFIFYSFIANIFESKFSMINGLWKLVALNISVQILIMPLTIYYFHQLPTYSIFNSIISTPFIVLMMWLGITAIVVKDISAICDIVFLILNHILRIYTHILDFFSSLPYAIIKNWELGITDLILSITSALLLYYLTIKSNFRMKLIFFAFIPIILLSSFRNILSKPTEITIYDTPNQLVIDLKHKNKTTRLLGHEEDYYTNYYVRNLDTMNSDNSTQLTLTGIDNQLIKFKKKQLYILNKNINDSAPAYADICVLTKANLAFEEVLECSQIIIPRSLTSQQLSPSILQYKNTYFIHKNGAFTIKY